jgi:regulator of protease activity HflC (stomatin/prohibitin superfamily)
MSNNYELKQTIFGKMKSLGIIVIFVILIVLGAISFTSVVDVKAGHRVILVDPLTSSITQGARDPSIFFKLPWQKAIDIYYAMDSVAMWTEWEETSPDQWRESGRGDFPAITALSKDGLQIEVDLLVRWSLNPDKLTDLFKRYPDLTWKEKAITSIVREVSRNVISKYSAIDVIEKRDLILSDLKSSLRDAILADVSLDGVIVSDTLDVDLRGIDPPFEFLSAIQDKLKAQQMMISAEYKKEEIIVLAQGEAEKRVIEAQGLANATIIQATSVKEAISLICSAANVTDRSRIAELYITLDALKEIAKDTNSLILILGTDKDGVPFVLPLNQTR